MYKTEVEGVEFYEGMPEGFMKGNKISTQLDGFFSSSQTSSLTDVKKAMAKYCKENGGNAVVSFNYGQRALGFFESMMSRDNVIWYGEGYIATRINCD